MTQPSMCSHVIDFKSISSKTMIRDTGEKMEGEDSEKKSEKTAYVPVNKELD